MFDSRKGELPIFQKRVDFKPDKDENALYACIKPLLCFGKLCGYHAIQGIFTRNGGVEDLVDRKKSIAGTYPLLVVLSCAFKTIACVCELLYTKNSRSIIEVAHKINIVFWEGLSLAIVLFLYVRSDQLIQILGRWAESTNFINRVKKPFQKLVIIGAGMTMLSGIGENVMWFVLFFLHNKPKIDEQSTIFEYYWSIYCVHLQPFMSLNKAVVIIHFFAEKLSNYAWHFGHAFISVFAVLTYKRFEESNLYVLKLIQNETHKMNKEVWRTAVANFENLLDDLEETGNFLSPLAFSCISGNVVTLSIRIHDVLQPSDNAKTDFYNLIRNCWALFHFFGSWFGMSILCSRINDHVQDFARVLRKCPAEYKSQEMARLESDIRLRTFGFHGWRFFTITKPFILSILNVFLVLEIVLLQGHSNL